MTDGRSTPQDLLDFLRARPVSPTPGGTGSVAEMVAWASTLPTGQAEADDDFFAVGGNSLLAVQLVAQVQQKLRIDDEHNYLLMTNLLNEPTLRAFISTVEEELRAGRVPQKTCTAPVDSWRPDASVPVALTGCLIQAKGWLIQLRPTGRDELTE